MVYHFGGRYFGVLYKAKYYKMRLISGQIYNVIFIPCFNKVVIGGRSRYDFQLFDTTKGSFSGKIIIPKNDACFWKQSLRVQFSVYGKSVIVFCPMPSLHLTIYDTAEFYKSGNLQLILKEGISLPVKGAYLIFNKDVYTVKYPYIVIFRKENMYKPVKHFVENMKDLRNCKNVRYTADTWSDMVLLYCTPGPHAIGFSTLYNPRNGIIRKGNGKTTIRELRMLHFDPLCNDIVFKHFKVYPADGSFWHFIASPQKKTDDIAENLTSIDSYKRVKLA
jgi:hypothetical protein